MDFYKKLVAIVLSCTVVGMAGGNVSFFAEEAVEMPADAVSQKNESNFSKYIKHGVEIGAGILGAVGCAAFATELYLMNREIKQLEKTIISQCSNLKSVGISESDAVEFLNKRSEEIQNVLQKKIEKNNELSQKIEECERNNKNVIDELQKVYNCWACSTLYSKPYDFENKGERGELFSNRYLLIKSLLYIFIYAPKCKNEDELKYFKKNIRALRVDDDGIEHTYRAGIKRWKMWANEDVNGYLNLLLSEIVENNKRKGDKEKKLVYVNNARKEKNLVYVNDARKDEFKSMITFLDGINTLTSDKEKFGIAREVSKCVLGQIIFQKLDSENVISSNLMEKMTSKINRDRAVVKSYMNSLNNNKGRAVEE